MDQSEIVICVNAMQTFFRMHIWKSDIVCIWIRMIHSNFLDPTLKRSEMTEHLRRDYADPSEDLRGSQPSAIILN